MPRILIATLAGIVGLALYIMAAVAAADLLGPMHWATQLGYFVVAGSIWVFPVRWLMLWAAGQR
jgi:hypothetical protein